MPCRPRFCPAGMPVHIIQRGNNRQTCFAKDADLAAYANWLAEYTDKFEIKLYTWVFMTNHVHLLLTSETNHGVSKLMQALVVNMFDISTIATPEPEPYLRGDINLASYSRNNTY